MKCLVTRTLEIHGYDGGLWWLHGGECRIKGVFGSLDPRILTTHSSTPMALMNVAFRQRLHKAKFLTLGSSGLVCQEERWNILNVHWLPRTEQADGEESLSTPKDRRFI
ncbi:hypothetical protein Tco_1120163 [Tanacetum coccineum]